MTTNRRLFALAGLLVACFANPLTAQAPPSSWVEMFDQGEIDLRLKGINTPRGVKLEIVAEGAVVGQPLAIAFGERGTLFVLQGSTDKSPGQLVALRDADADGKIELREVIMNDLAGQTSLLLDDGWFYFVGKGQVLRRRTFDAKLADASRAAADARKGPPTSVTPDGKWIEQTLIRGLSDGPADQTGGLTHGLDGAIYLAIGGTSNRTEGWDGSKATVVGSGAIFRFRPDGSKVQEFARGFAIPAGAPALDAVGNVFRAERNSVGSRLVHVLEGGDFGWRADIDPPRLDRPGTLPAMLQSAPLTANSALVCRGPAFPKQLQGVLLVADAQAAVVQAYVIVADGNSFAARQQFELLRGGRDAFGPSILAIGPEGAIYLVDSRPAGSRVLRLTWSGTKSMPAIETPVLAKFEPPTPLSQADSLALAQVKAKAAPERASALGRACRQWDNKVLEACLAILEDENADLARLAADALGDHLPADTETQQRIADAMQQKVLAGPLPVRRSLYIALGKLGTKLDTVPEWIFEASSVTPDVHTNRYLFDAHARAAEMPKGWATELMLGNLEVALFDPNPEPQERHRLKKFVTATAEQMRTRELANFLDKSIRDEKDYFSKLDAPFQARLLAAYQNVLVDPAINADAIAMWLEKHPMAALEVQQAGWATLAMLGTSKPESVIAPAKALVTRGKLDATLKQSVLAALARHRDPAKRGEIDEVMDSLSRVTTQSP
jgi:quinoprotein glucose dehydrogenase